MKGRTRTTRGAAFVLTVALAVAATLATGGHALADPGMQCAPTTMESVSTDQESYPPGETVYITGGGFAVACEVEVRLTRPDGVVETASVSTDLGGNVSHEYVLPPFPGVLGMYTLEAIGLGGVVLASHTFTDGPEIRSDLVPGYVTSGGVNPARTYSVLVRNTGDTVHRCARVTLPAGYASISVLSTDASQGSFTSSINGQVITFSNSTGISAATNSGTTINGWARFDIQASPPNNGPNGTDWTFRAASAVAAGSPLACPNTDQTSNENVRIVAGTQPTDRRYTAEFVTAAGAPITTPITTDSNVTFRLRMTKQTDSQSNKISYFGVGLPRCLTNISISSAGENSSNGFDWTAAMFGKVVRWSDPTSGELDDGHSVTLTFTANTTGCALSSHAFASTGWEDATGSAGNAPSKLFTTTAGPTVTFVAANTAPTVVANNAAVTVDEGQTAENSGVWGDANLGDTVTLSASIGTVAKSGTNAAGTWSWSYPTTDGPDETQVVTITANDGTASTSTTFELNVNNVAPTATFDNNGPVDEGSAINLSLGSPNDPSAVDTAAGFEYRFSCDDGATWTGWGSTTSHSCGTNDNGLRNVKGEIRDTDGGTSTYSASITVNNLAPTATFNAPASVDEGSGVNLSLSDVVDPGSGDTHEYRFSCDGGTAWTDWSSAASHSCSADDNGTWSVNGQVRDDDGGTSEEYSASVTVDNVAPSATFSAPESVDEGSDISVSLSNVVDPGTADTHHYRFKCGADDWTDYGNSASHGCATTDNGTVVVKGQVQDDDGGESAEYSASVTVANVPPSATFNAPESVDEGADINLSLTDLVDPGTADTHEYRFSCDGETWTAWSSTLTHSCATSDNGTVQVRGQVRDDEGDASEVYSDSVTVDNVAPSATFNAPTSVNEGSDIEISLTSPSDPSSADTAAGFEYRFSCDDGATWSEWGSSNSDTCATDDNGAESVKAEIRDKDSGTSTYSASVSVENVAPTATFNAPTLVDEGSDLNLSLSDVVDPSSADTAAGFEYAFDCGSGYGPFGSSNEAGCATDDNGVRAVKGKIRDKDGGVSEYTAEVTVENVAPTASFETTSPVAEGSDIELALSGAFDPSSADSAAGFEYAFDCGFGYGPFGSSNEAGCATDDNGVRAVKGKIRDKDGGVSEYTAEVTVENVAPTATFNAPASVDEGSDINLSLSDVVDPGGADTHEYRFKCGDGDWADWGASASAACATTDNGSVTVFGQVRDDDGGESGQYSAAVTVENVAPTATFNAPASVDEGSSIENSLTDVVDPGSADMHEYRFKCGVADWTAYGSNASHSCATTDNGSVVVKGQVRDDDGGESGEYSAAVTVENVAPSATFNAPVSVNEGSDIEISLTSPSDPSSADTAAGFENRFSCDDGDTWTGWGASNDHSCPTSDNGTAAVRGQIRDKDLGVNEYSANITVDNVAPSVTITSPASGALYPAGGTIPVTASFTDPGTADTHNCTINGSPGVVTESNGSGSCAGSVVASPGGNTITVVVTDDDGGSGTASVTVSALYAIYAQEKCSGGAGKGVLVNGANASVGGFVHSNGNFAINGSNFQSGRASIHRSSTNNCKAVYDPAKVNFGAPSPTAPIQESAARDWPRNFSRSEFACTSVKDEFVFNQRGQTIPPGVYCANKVFKINADNITGKITVLAPEIVINGKNVSLTPHTKGVLMFNINLNGTLSPKEIVLDSDFSGDIHYLSGLLFNPGAGIKVNGSAVTIRNGFLQALWVEVNLSGFRMVY